MVDSFQALEFRNTQASNIENIEPVCRFNPYETYYVWSGTYIWYDPYEE